MDQKQQAAFYTGAALFLRLDAAEVAAVLTAAGLDAATSPLDDCIRAVKAAYPERYEAGKRSHYRQLIVGDPDAQ